MSNDTTSNDINVTTSSGDEAATVDDVSTKQVVGSIVGPPASVTVQVVPTSACAAPSPVTTKSKSNINSNSNSNNNSTNNNTKSLTVTVNGNDRSKDLNEHDVVCEKGRGDHERWPGNKLYRHLINVNKETYNDLAPIERSNIIGKIIGTIQEKDGWFVHHSEASGKWAKLTEEKVRKKVSDDLRREVRRRREKRSHNSLFSAKLRAIKEMEEVEAAARDILERVDDPRQTDVLFGPGARRHPGNKTYWHHMKLNLDQYIISPYGARSVISRNIVQIIRSQHGRFLEQDPKTGIWYSISDKRALEKTSHALSNMKYKTRKRHPDEPLPPPSPHSSHLYHHAAHHGVGVPPPPSHHPHHAHHPHHPHHAHQQHHLAYRVAPYGEEVVYHDDCDITVDQEKIHEADSPNTIFAKKRTKKFRLLNRMGDDVSVEQTPLKGKDSNSSSSSSSNDSDLAGSSTENNTSSNTPSTTKAVDPRDDPTATPGPGMKGAGKVISPNSSQTSASSESIEYQEQRNPNAYHRVQHVPATGMPPVADVEYGPNYRGGNGGAADIAPRIAHFDYIKNYGAPAPGAGPGGGGPGATAFKTLTYAAGMRGDEYAAHHGGPHAPHHRHMRHYLAPSLEHGGPMPRSAGTPGSTGGPANAYADAALAARRRVLKVAGPAAGYWVNNDWAGAAPEYY